MKLNDLLKNVKPLNIEGDADKDMKVINIDSRKIELGHLFIAIKGTQTDGHKYIEKAIELGATAILLEEMPTEPINKYITYIQVKSTEEAVGNVATTFYGNPSHHLKLVGVTGTNGKTTVATLLYNMFRKFGYKVGFLQSAIILMMKLFQLTTQPQIQ